MKYTKFFTLLIVIFSFLVLSHKLPSSFIFHPDFARDVFDITRISQGKLMLIGPKLTFGGIYSGPYYYYLLLPILALTNYSINALLYFNTALFAVALGFLFYELSRRFSIYESILGVSVILFSPFYLIASRNPSNAFTYIPFLIILLTILYFYKITKPKQLILMGIFAGILVTFHLVVGSVVAFASLMLLADVKKRQHVLWYFLGFPIAFLPLILFELKHNFIMLKNTFIDKSYLLWVKNSNIPGGITGKKNPIENFVFISQAMQKFTVVNPLVLFVLAGVKHHAQRFTGKDGWLLMSSLLSLVLLALTMRFQFIYHYLFATILLLLFTTVIIFLKQKWHIFLIILLALELTYIPKEMYDNSWRKYQTYEQTVNYVLENKLLQNGESFNVIQVTEPDLLSPNGFEYRFYLQQHGFKPESEFAYKTSKKLLIFSEKPEYDIKKLDSWESREFGTEFLPKAKKYSSGAITIYVTEK